VTKRWHRADFTEAWADYLPQHPQQTNETGPQPPISEPQHDAAVADLKTLVPPIKPGSVAGVADKTVVGEGGNHDRF